MRPTTRLAPSGALVLFSAVVGLAVVATPTRALAQRAEPLPPAVSRDAHAALGPVERGAAAATAGRHAEAAAAFEEAFVLLGEPSLLYNVALETERAGDAAGAARAYDRFLAAAPAESVPPGLRSHVEELRARQASPNAATPILLAWPEGPSGPAAPGGPLAPVTHRPSRVGPVVLLAAGGASLVAAAVFAGLRASALSPCDVSDNGAVAHCPTTEARDAAAQAPTWALGANLAAGAGIAALASGVLWWALTPSHAEAPAAPAVTVGAGPSGVVVAGRF